MGGKDAVRYAILIGFVAATLSAPICAAQTITVGTTNSTSDAPIFIADRKGYFRAEGLDVKVVAFRSASDMVVLLGVGQIEAGAGSASAGLYNAFARGIRIKIVADKASSPPGYGGTKILVRRDHVESGRYRDIKDLRGMRFAMNAPGVSNTSTLNTLLKSVGLRYADVETINLPFPDHVVALKNKSVDAAASVEPAPTIAIHNGDAQIGIGAGGTPFHGRVRRGYMAHYLLSRLLQAAAPAPLLPVAPCCRDPPLLGSGLSVRRRVGWGRHQVAPRFRRSSACGPVSPPLRLSSNFSLSTARKRRCANMFHPRA
jgi:ABC-type nitrate/sulfonate/bicarbonate transport system substrate-binding protein